MSTKKFIISALLVCAVIAGGFSFYASSNPDGLEKVAADQSLDVNAKDSLTADSPLSDYGVNGVENDRLSVGASGLAGVVIVGVAGLGLYFWVRKSESN
jgi:hypothetical protein